MKKRRFVRVYQDQYRFWIEHEYSDPNDIGSKCLGMKMVSGAEIRRMLRYAVGKKGARKIWEDFTHNRETWPFVHNIGESNWTGWYAPFTPPKPYYSNQEWLVGQPTFWLEESSNPPGGWSYTERWVLVPSTI